MSVLSFPKTHNLHLDLPAPIIPISNEGKRANEAAKDIIRQHEGFHATPFLGKDKIWVIGYAHSRTVRAGMSITKGQAEVLMEEDLHYCERTVARLCSVPLTDNQFSALVSFVADVGVPIFENSAMLQLLNRGWYAQVPAQLMRWKGQKMDFTRASRRRAEGRLWSQE